MAKTYDVTVKYGNPKLHGSHTSTGWLNLTKEKVINTVEGIIESIDDLDAIVVARHKND